MDTSDDGYLIGLTYTLHRFEEKAKKEDTFYKKHDTVFDTVSPV